jgi:purine-binding chemotaxis protein CheW
MNLSDIRKKAQQEKSANGGQSPLPVENGLPEAPSGVEEETASAEIVDNAGFEAKPPERTLQPEAPQPDDFDPLALLMAGRAAARGCDDTAPSEETATEEEGAGYHELLCFRVAAERYAVDIMEIREIIKPREVTEVPRMPPFVNGVLSLRGIIIPVFNMRERLGHASSEASGKERVIVLNRGEESCGVLVDEVIQVARLEADSIEPAPAVLEGIDRDFVKGIGRIEERMLILLNMDKILDIDLH